MPVLVLDTRALEVVADPAADRHASRRVQSMLTSAARLGVPVRVPTAVLAEAYRGTPADAAVDRVLGHGIRPITMGHTMARLAGRLRHRDRLNSCHTVDAFVVATAVRLGGGIIATGDPEDLRSLARDHPNVKVEPLAESR
jgi:predicted nucleic acid-binding protein